MGFGLQHTRAIIQLSWPMLIGQLAVLANGVADTIMVGHYHPDHLAAIGVGASIYATVFVVLMGVLQGLSPLIARHFGAGEFAPIGLLVRQGAWLALAVSALGLLLLAYPETLLRWARLPDNVLPLAQDYLRVVAWGLPAVLLVRVFYAFTQAVGQPRAVMVINLLGLSIKIPLSYALLHGLFGLPELGMVGCGVASALAYWLIFALALWLLSRDAFYRGFALFRGPLRPDWSAIQAILALGLPIAIGMLVEVTSFTFMALLLARLGAVVSGAHQIVSNLAALFFMVPLSLGVGTQILVSHALGRGDLRQARQIALAGLRLALGIALIVSGLLMTLDTQVVRLYTSHEEVAALALTLLPIMAAFHVFDAVQGVAAQALRGYHRTMAPMLIYSVALWGFGLGGGYWLAFEGLRWPALGLALAPQGAAGMWAAGAFSLLLAASALVPYLLRVSRSSSR